MNIEPQFRLLNNDDGTFDFTLIMRGRTQSAHTHRAYYRWVDRFLVDVGYDPGEVAAYLQSYNEESE